MSFQVCLITYANKLKLMMHGHIRKTFFKNKIMSYKLQQVIQLMPNFIVKYWGLKYKERYRTIMQLITHSFRSSINLTNHPASPHQAKKPNRPSSAPIQSGSPQTHPSLKWFGIQWDVSQGRQQLTTWWLLFFSPYIILNKFPY